MAEQRLNNRVSAPKHPNRDEFLGWLVGIAILSIAATLFLPPDAVIPVILAIASGTLPRTKRH